MIVLKKINTDIVEKIILPGETEEFFKIDLNSYESFEWKVKALINNQRGITKIFSLYTGSIIESTSYAFLGEQFKADIDIFIYSGNYCVFNITNNESLPMNCSVAVKKF